MTSTIICLLRSIYIPALSLMDLFTIFYLCILRVYGILASHMILNVYIWYKTTVCYCIFRLFNTLSEMTK